MNPLFAFLPPVRHRVHPLFHALASSIRYGFATNSSSSHSIVLLERRQDVQAVADEWAPANPGTYGWEWFALTTEKEKRDYLWVNLYQQALRLVAPEDPPWTFADERLKALPAVDTRPFASALACLVLECDPPEFAELLGEPYSIYIDHDSTFSFPIDPATHAPHIDFARWFVARALDPRAVVLGGNDNVSSPYTRPDGKDLRAPLRDDEYQAPSFCYDRGDHWLLFDKANGTKLRVPKVDGTAIPFSTVPELVDIKITDQCGMGCKFCYQGSTPAGKHAVMRPYEVGQAIKDLGVLEVAIGGGEPFEHPDVWYIIDAIRQHAVVNVTTRRLDLVPFYKLDKLGGVGFSTESAAVLEAALRKIGVLDDSEHGRTYENPWSRKLVVHVVLGAMTRSALVDILRVAERAGMGVLLLAFKRDGRGASFDPFEHGDWVDHLRRTFHDKHGRWTGPRLGVDTPIVERWGDEIASKLEVDPRLMSPGEGRFSMYIDFVRMEAAAASYGDAKRTPLAYDHRKHNAVGAEALEAFRSWHR